jgi:hypothetical protein
LLWYFSYLIAQTFTIELLLACPLHSCLCWSCFLLACLFDHLMAGVELCFCLSDFVQTYTNLFVYTSPSLWYLFQSSILFSWSEITFKAKTLVRVITLLLFIRFCSDLYQSLPHHLTISLIPISTINSYLMVWNDPQS